MLNQYKGLTSDSARLLLKQYGANESVKNDNSAFKILLKQFESPIIYLLLLTVIISLFTGDNIAAVVLAILITINTAIGFFQEYQSAQLASKLHSLIKKETLVFRDNEFVFVQSNTLVPGDIIKLKLGDIIPADCKIIECTELFVDESSMTGETENIFKNINDEVASGTNITKGSGVFEVLRTGKNSKIGSIANLALNTAKSSEFNKKMLKLSKGFMIIGFVFLVVIFGLQLFLGKVDQWQSSLIFILALTISIIPEALPIVTSITLSTQALKLGKKGLLVKHQTVLEDLGNMDVFCSDKTGTLTENKFNVVEDQYNQELLEIATFISVGSNDNFDTAVTDYVNIGETKIGVGQNTVDIPFDPKTRISGKSIPALNKSYLHGSYNEILNKVNNISEQEKQTIQLQLNAKEVDGIKCLSFAVQTEDSCEYKGTIYFQDILKADAKALITRCNELGLEIKILTGDSLNVARHVGYQSEFIDQDNEAASTVDIDFTLPPDQLYEIVKKYKIIARCNPEQKFMIIKALQTRKVVGYLGDGINDAPALKAAQIGIVVDTSSAIAKETSDIIMTSKNLDSLIDGIENGRSIYENINKYLKATLSSSFGNFFTMGLLSLVLPFNPMLGIQVILSDLITDMPLISLSDDNVNKSDIRKPKHQNLPRLILVCLTLGLISSIFDFIFVALNKGLPPEQIQTSWFFFSICTELLILFSVRTRTWFFKDTGLRSNTIVYSVLAFLATILISTTLFKYMNIATIGISQVIFLAFVSVIYFCVSEIVKVIYYKIYKNQVE
jgi:P-type Mg2+ transporter